MKILVIGASGMIGSTVLRVLSECSEYQVYGSLRNSGYAKYFASHIQERLINNIEILHDDKLVELFELTTPDVVINCAGLTKHKPDAENPLLAVPINSLAPHRLARLSELAGARLIHVSTDCVFSGAIGGYKEYDFRDADDLYGRSKILGEVEYPHAITLRTSTIGHELQTKYGLLEWFLSQGESCKGFSRAIFSGLPTVVFAQVIRDVIIPHNKLNGLYHIAAEPINKFDLLKLIAKCYQKDIEIICDDLFEIDRSLNSDRFKLATGYEAPEWPELIQIMHEYG